MSVGCAAGSCPAAPVGTCWAHQEEEDDHEAHGAEGDDGPRQRRLRQVPGGNRARGACVSLPARRHRPRAPRLPAPWHFAEPVEVAQLGRRAALAGRHGEGVGASSSLALSCKTGLEHSRRGKQAAAGSRRSGPSEGACVPGPPRHAGRQSGAPRQRACARSHADGMGFLHSAAAAPTGAWRPRRPQGWACPAALVLGALFLTAVPACRSARSRSPQEQRLAGWAGSVCVAGLG